MSTHIDASPDSRLVDPRTGIVSAIRRVRMPDNLPAELVMYDSVLSDTRRWCDWESDSTGGGCSLGDDNAARGAALGEAVERYCGNLIPAVLPRGTASEMTTAGHHVLPLDDVALFSPEQHRTPGFPFVPLDETVETEWAAGTNLDDDSVMMVPAPLVWVSYIAAIGQRGMRHVCPIIQAGLAAGPDADFATRSALTEIVERDAMTMAWHGRADLRWLDPGPEIRSLACGRHNSLETRFVVLPNDTECVVVGALVRDRETGYLTMGTCARPEARPATLKALAEACQLQRFVRDYDDPFGPYMQAALDQRSPLAPWRSDRKYLDHYCPAGIVGGDPDLDRVRDYGCHLQMYLDPRMQDLFETELSEACVATVTLTELDAEIDDPVNGMRDLVQRLISRGSTVVRVDVTTPDVAAAGMRVVRVLATGRYSNSPAGLPFLGGSRLAAQLSQSGRPRRVIPLPH